MCMTALSDYCCVDEDYVPGLDIMAHLELQLERDVSICTAAPAMLLPEMADGALFLLRVLVCRARPYVASRLALT